MVIWVGDPREDGERRAPDWWAGWLAMQRSRPNCTPDGRPGPGHDGTEPLPARYRTATQQHEPRTARRRAQTASRDPVAWSGHVRASRPLPVRRRHCLVTGASSGIGRAVAERLIADGWTVTVLVRRDGGTGRDAHRRRATPPRRPTCRPPSTGAVDAAGRLHGLVCAAGLPPSGPWDDADHWADVLRVDLTAPYDAARLAWPGLVAARGARWCSWAASWAPAEGSARSPAYAAAKAGLEGLVPIARGHRRARRRARERRRAGCHRHPVRHGRLPAGRPSGRAARSDGHRRGGRGRRGAVAVRRDELRDRVPPGVSTADAAALSPRRSAAAAAARVRG